MDYFEKSIEIKSKLEDSIIFNFLKNRIIESCNGNNIENLIIKSKNNHVYRIGFLDDLPMALRIPYGVMWLEDSELNSKHEVETYCVNSEKVYNKGNINMSRFCLPVKYIDDSGDNAYSLLVQDLTDWGRFIFPENNMGHIISKLESREGNDSGEYYVDMGPRSFSPYTIEDLEYKYTNNSLDLT